MTWLTIFKLLLTLADKIADVIRANQLMNAGEAKATAKQLASIAERLRITEEIRSEVDALSESDLDKELAKDDASENQRTP